jgi:hypothetical protein
LDFYRLVSQLPQSYVGEEELQQWLGFTRLDCSFHTGNVFGKAANIIFNYGYGGKEITEKSKFKILPK